MRKINISFLFGILNLSCIFAVFHANETYIDIDDVWIFYIHSTVLYPKI